MQHNFLANAYAHNWYNLVVVTVVAVAGLSSVVDDVQRVVDSTGDVKLVIVLSAFDHGCRTAGEHHDECSMVKD